MKKSVPFSNLYTSVSIINRKDLIVGLVGFIVFFIFYSNLLHGQQKGIFQRTINFSYPWGSTIQVAFYVPNSYNASQPTKLILVAHGSSGIIPNPAGGGAFLLPYYKPFADSLNAILVLPDIMHPNWKVKEILSALNYAKTQYNIDNNYIYLAGWSLGGRGALQLGLDNYSIFRGIIPFPAIQSIAEANNQTSFVFAYQNSVYIPSCICAGSLDPYWGTAATAHNNILGVSGMSQFWNIPGQGHDPGYAAFTTVNLSCVDYIDQLTKVGTLSTPEINSNSAELIMYPNPFKNATTIIINKELKNASLIIYDMLGKEVQTLNDMELLSDKNRTIISIENLNLTEGIYFYKLLSIPSLNNKGQEEDVGAGKFMITSY